MTEWRVYVDRARGEVWLLEVPAESAHGDYAGSGADMVAAYLPSEVELAEAHAESLRTYYARLPDREVGS